MSIQSEITRINNEVSAQKSLISQIKSALQGKVSGSGGATEDLDAVITENDALLDELSAILDEKAGGGSTQWLFKDEYIEFGRGDLPALSDGVSYTAFVDGEEIETKIGSRYGETYFEKDNRRVCLIYQSEDNDFVYWQFHPMDSQVQSGTVSIRINEQQSGGGWILSNVANVEYDDVYIENGYIYAYNEPCYVTDNGGNLFYFDPYDPLDLSELDTSKTYEVWNDIGGHFIANLVYQ
jgi:hypothetical protein